jgi:hypothetical protein
MCGTGFSARSDAVYCSSACRQKAHRARTARRIADLRARVVRTTRPVLADPNAAGKSLQRAAAGSIQRAREQVQRSRELCRISTERLQQAAAIQQQFGKEAADAAFPAASRPICTKAVLWRGNQTAKP